MTIQPTAALPPRPLSERDLGIFAAALSRWAATASQRAKRQLKPSKPNGSLSGLPHARRAACCLVLCQGALAVHWRMSALPVPRMGCEKRPR